MGFCIYQVDVIVYLRLVGQGLEGVFLRESRVFNEFVIFFFLVERDGLVYLKDIGQFFCFRIRLYKVYKK